MSSRSNRNLIGSQSLPVAAEATPGSAVASPTTVTAVSSIAAPASVSTPATATAPPGVHNLAAQERRQQHQQHRELKIKLAL